MYRESLSNTQQVNFIEAKVKWFNKQSNCLNTI